ncbi:MAG: hypothetical protein ABIF71_04390 [Planctomycetota bacterium]
MKKSAICITIGVILVVLLAGWRIGERWYLLRKVNCNPQAKYRATVVATELQLVNVQVTPGVTCNVGYAEFIIPNTSSVDMQSDGSAVVGESDAMTFALLAPWNPSVPNEITARFKDELVKLPEGHPLREELAKPGLDMLVQVERAAPDPFWKAVLEDRHLFAFNNCQLALKGAMQYGGHSVHTYQTPETRGLILVGKRKGDVSCATLCIENRSGTQAVGMIARLPNGKVGDIMDVLPPVVKSFRFIVSGLDSRERIMEIIEKAGIRPKQDGQ